MMTISFLLLVVLAPCIIIITAFPMESQVPLHNWGYSYEFTATKVLTPSIYEDVAAIIKDQDTYPSPIRALGHIHSVTECVVNAGTIISTKELDKIMGVDVDSQGRQVVKVQAGVTLKTLDMWLGNRGLEIYFMAEIGDASVGSLAVAVSKDSGVGDEELTGTLYKSITEMVYVDHEGVIFRVDDSTLSSRAQLDALKTSEGLLGIVLEVTLLVRPQTLITFSLRTVATHDIVANFSSSSGDDLPLSADRNMLILLRPDYSFVEERRIAPPGAVETDEKQWSVITSFIRNNIASGTFSLDFSEESAAKPPITLTTYRRHFVNHYEEPLKNQSRLDFAFWEFPVERFDTIIPAYLDFLQQFAKENDGFEPSASAIYFVKRIPTKSFGWFSQTGQGFDQPGYSFTCDAVFNDPNDPMWHRFLLATVDFAFKYGGRGTLTQSRLLTREDYLSMPGNVPHFEAPNRRFTSEYYSKFVVSEAPAVPNWDNVPSTSTTTTTTAVLSPEDHSHRSIGVHG